MKKFAKTFICLLLSFVLAFGVVACSDPEVGPQGEKGDQGIQGLAGPKGDKGDKGDDGETGKDGEPAVSAESDWANYTYEPNQNIWTFGWAHQATIGFANIRTDGNGKLVTPMVGQSFDEIFNLSGWTKITDAAKTTLTAENVLTIGSNNWIKYILVGDTYYVAQGVESAASGVPNLTDTLKADSSNVRYFPLDGKDKTATDLSTWAIGEKSIDTLMVEESLEGDNERALAYYDFCKDTALNLYQTEAASITSGLLAVKKNKTTLPVSRLGNDTTILKYAAGSTSSGAATSPFKAYSGYGPASGTYTQGILGSLQFSIDFVLKYGYDFDVDSMVRSGYTKNVWLIDNGAGVVVNTGVTANDTPNYLTLLQRACQQLVSRVVYVNALIAQLPAAPTANNGLYEQLFNEVVAELNKLHPTQHTQVIGIGKVNALSYALYYGNAVDAPALKVSTTSRVFTSTIGTSSHCGVAFAEITTNNSGEVETLKLDELFIPQEWAKLTLADALQLSGGTAMNNDYVVALAGRSGAISLYPKFIEITGLGTGAEVYMARIIATSDIGKDTATDVTAFYDGTGSYAGLKIMGSAASTYNGSGCVRYFKVTTPHATMASVVTEAKSLEYRMITSNGNAAAQETAQNLCVAYYNLLSGITAGVATSAIQYHKATTSGTFGATTQNKVQTIRESAPRAYAATLVASTSAIGFGAPQNTSATADLSGNDLAYATTFFKGGSTYTPGYPVTWDEGQYTKPSDRSEWDDIADIVIDFVNSVGLHNLKAEPTTTNRVYEGIEIGASLANTGVYIDLIYQAYQAIISTSDISALTAAIAAVENHPFRWSVGYTQTAGAINITTKLAEAKALSVSFPQATIDAKKTEMDDIVTALNAYVTSLGIAGTDYVVTEKVRGERVITNRGTAPEIALVIDLETDEIIDVIYAYANETTGSGTDSYYVAWVGGWLTTMGSVIGTNVSDYVTAGDPAVGVSLIGSYPGSTATAPSRADYLDEVESFVTVAAGATITCQHFIRSVIAAALSYANAD